MLPHAIRKHEFSFGAPGYFIDVPDAEVIYFDIYLNSGYYYSEPGKYDLPHLVEHCLFENNRYYGSGTNLKYQTEKIGGEMNGFSSNVLNYYVINSPKEKYLELTDIILRLVNEPVFTESEFKKEKEVIYNELSRNKNDFNKDLMNDADSFLMKGKISYQERLEELQNIQFEDLMNYYKKTHCPANMSFVICGDLKDIEPTIIEKIEDYYKEKKIGKRNVLPSLFKRDYYQKILSKDVEEKKDYDIMINFIQDKLNYDDHLGILFFCYIFMFGMGSRMSIKARERGLTYSPGMDIGYYREYSDFTIYDTLEGKNIKEYIELLLSEINDMKAGNISEDEMERAKGYALGQIKKGYRTEGRIMDFYGSRLILGIEYEPIDVYIRKMEEMNKEKIVEVMNRCIRLDDWIAGIIGNKASEKEIILRETLPS